MQPSNRHQRGRRTWLAIGLVALGILAWTQVQPNRVGSDPASWLVDGAARPVRGALTSTSGWLGDTWYGLTHLHGLVGRTRELERRLTAAQVAERQSEELRQENQRLTQLLGLRSQFGHAPITARVIAHSPSPWFRTMTVDAGTKQGVRAGDVVLTGAGLVGLAYQVSAGSCRVLSLVDRQAAVGVRLQRADQRAVVGVLRGDGSTACVWPTESLNAKVVIGDVVVTSGAQEGSTYPAGLLVGYVASFRRDPVNGSATLMVQPAVAPEAVQEVAIVAGTGGAR